MTNDNDGMLSRVAKMVATPARDLLGNTGDAGPSQFADAEKAELKAMIERKRRNDFVRKRELDMLRRIRREGLSAEQANSLSSSSRLDDSDVRPTQLPGGPSPGVKAKIDAIEKQMVGVGMPSVPRAAPASPLVPGAAASVPQPVTARPVRVAPVVVPAPTPVPAKAAKLSFDEPPPLDAQSTVPVSMGATRPMVFMPDSASTEVMDPPPGRPTPPPVPPRNLPAQTALHTVTKAPPRTPSAPPAPTAPPAPARVALTPTTSLAPRRDLFSANTELGALEVSEIAHDHELDEAVIAFANADFALCERSLVQITSVGGSRHDHSDSWLVLFDLFRATGRQAQFDALVNVYVHHFQRSAPQWFSLPKLVAEATGQHAASRHGSLGAAVAWLCPAHLDLDGVTHLNSQTLQLPQPWVLDWNGLQHIDPDAASRLHHLMQSWAQQTLEMRWIGSDRLFTVLQEAAPVGVRDADPAYWMTRLEALRLVNRPDQFDEVAIDYCVTYEVSPPSWAPTRCTARVGSGIVHTQSAPLSVLSDGITSLMDATDGKSGYSMTTLELSGQLSGDISLLLGILDNHMGSAQSVHISCALLIRVDFIAAGDLLNWVIGKRAEGRWVRFTEVHRLVALMFGAMGITEHAQVQLRQA